MKKLFAAALVAATMFGTAFAAEYPLTYKGEVGGAALMNGMELKSAYLKPRAMEPHTGVDLKDTDIHLEIDLHATKGNQNGFGEGEWVPYINVHYVVTNMDNGKVTEGDFMPMVAADGPHYGANIKLNGHGKYQVVYRLDPPPVNGFHRHTDAETGVGQWWKPFELTYTFDWKGLPESEFKSN